LRNRGEIENIIERKQNIVGIAADGAMVAVMPLSLEAFFMVSAIEAECCAYVEAGGFAMGLGR